MATQQMSKAEKNALAVEYEVMGTKVSLDINFVKDYLVRGKSELVSNQELVFFINTCKSQHLNPLVNGEVYLIKYSENNPAQMVVGKATYLRRMYEHPEYLYKEDGITIQTKNGEIVQKEGCCLYPNEILIGGWCRVHYEKNGKERIAFKEVAFSEYNQGQSNWKSKPATMVNKVAISQCAREAFPKDYEGLYSEEEMIASGAIPTDATRSETVVETINEETGEVVQTIVEDVAISQDQRKELFSIAKEVYGDKSNEVLKKILSEEGFESTTGMPVSVWNRIKKKIKNANISENNGKTKTE